MLDDELDECDARFHYSRKNKIRGCACNAMYGSPHQNTKTHIWDVKDLDNPVLKNTYVSGQKAIDHNQYVVGDYTYQVCC